MTDKRLVFIWHKQGIKARGMTERNIAGQTMAVKVSLKKPVISRISIRMQNIDSQKMPTLIDVSIILLNAGGISSYFI